MAYIPLEAYVTCSATTVCDTGVIFMQVVDIIFFWTIVVSLLTLGISVCNNWLQISIYREAARNAKDVVESEKFAKAQAYHKEELRRLVLINVLFFCFLAAMYMVAGSADDSRYLSTIF